MWRRRFVFFSSRATLRDFVRIFCYLPRPYFGYFCLLSRDRQIPQMIARSLGSGFFIGERNSEGSSWCVPRVPGTPTSLLLLPPTPIQGYSKVGLEKSSASSPKAFDRFFFGCRGPKDCLGDLYCIPPFTLPGRFFFLRSLVAGFLFPFRGDS